jgi:uncharacterized membrane protein YdjX (TVP38/TMEM64 family)
MSTTFRRGLLVLVGVAIVGTLVFVITPGGRHLLGDGVAWLRASGSTGKLIAVGLVILGIPIGLPSLWLAALMGYVFGSFVGLALGIPAVLGGSFLAFLAARALFAEDVERLILRRPKWAAVTEAVGSTGWKLVALLRLWAPHNLLNLTLAATPVRPLDFALGSLIGSMPSVALATLGGALAPNAQALWTSIQALGGWSIVIIVLAVGGIIGALVVIRRAAKRALDRARMAAQK